MPFFQTFAFILLGFTTAIHSLGRGVLIGGKAHPPLSQEFDCSQKPDFFQPVICLGFDPEKLMVGISASIIETNEELRKAYQLAIRMDIYESLVTSREFFRNYSYQHNLIEKIVLARRKGYLVVFLHNALTLYVPYQSAPDELLVFMKKLETVALQMEADNIFSRQPPIGDCSDIKPIFERDKLMGYEIQSYQYQCEKIEALTKSPKDSKDSAVNAATDLLDIIHSSDLMENAGACLDMAIEILDVNDDWD